MNEKKYEEIKRLVIEYLERKDMERNESEIDRERRIWKDKVRIVKEKWDEEERKLKERGWIKRVWDWIVWMMDDDYIGYGSKKMRRWG